MKIRSILSGARAKASLLAVVVLAGLIGGGVAMPASPAQAQTLVGIECDGFNGAAPCIGIQVAPIGFVCTGPINDIDVGINLPGSGWDNRISSYANLVGGSVCWTAHFDGINGTGAFEGPLPAPLPLGLNLGLLNNLSSSIVYT